MSLLLPIESKMEVFARTYSKDTGVSVSVGANACTDGKRIWVPPIPDQSDPYLRLTTEMFTYHETGHVKTGDYPTFETLSKTGPKSKATVFNIVRDVVVEHTMETEYPGMVTKWTEFLKPFITKKTNKEMTSKATPVLRKLILLIYTRCREKQLGTDLGLVVPKEIQELFDAKLVKFVDPILNHSDVADSAKLTEEIYTAIKEDIKPKEQKSNGSKRQKSDDETGGSPRDGEEPMDSDAEESDQDPEDGTSGSSGAASNDDTGDEETGSSGQEDDQGDPSGDSPAEDPASTGGEGSEGDNESASGDKDGTEVHADSSVGSDDQQGSEEDDKEPDPLSKAAEDALKQAREELEDDNTDGKSIMDDAAELVNKYVAARHIYREAPGLQENIVRIKPRPGWEFEVNLYEDSGRKMTGYSGQRMKVLFISEKAPHYQQNLRSGKLDTKKLHRLTTGCQDICKRKMAGVYEDSAVYLVIDHSGSMDSKREIAQPLLTALASDLDKLRIPFGAVGFTTDSDYGPEADHGVRSVPCTLNLIKDFEEPYRRVRHRFVWPSFTNNTAEFPAIKFGAYKLAERRETKKVLFIITDGGTAIGNPELNSAMRDATKEFIERLLRAGVKVVGIGIQDSNMAYYCPDFILVDDLTTFAATFYSKLTKLIL
jgi:cobalamin biosynthesis protein CobT